MRPDTAGPRKREILQCRVSRLDLKDLYTGVWGIERKCSHARVSSLDLNEPYTALYGRLDKTLNSTLELSPSKPKPPVPTQPPSTHKRSTRMSQSC